MRCRTKGGQECDYIHLGAEFYYIWGVFLCLLKCLSWLCWSYGVSWWAEVQPKQGLVCWIWLFSPRFFYRFDLKVLVKNLISDFWYHREKDFCEIVYFELYVRFCWFCFGNVLGFLVWFWFCFFLQWSWMTEGLVVWKDLHCSISSLSQLRHLRFKSF